MIKMKILFFLSLQILLIVQVRTFNITETVKNYLFNKIYEDFGDDLLSNFSSGNNFDEYKSNLKVFQQQLVENRRLSCDNKKIKYTELNFSARNESIFNYLELLTKSEPNTKEFLNYSAEILKFFGNKCVSSESLVDLFVDKSNFKKDFKHVLNIVLSQSSNIGCDPCLEHDKEKPKKITELETWGYGILSVTLISLSSLFGAVVIPFSNTKIYKLILMCLIGLAIGSLAGSGFLHLIPQAYGITEDEKYSEGHAYIWKSLVIMGGIYLFYLVEKLMNLLIQRKNTLKKGSYSLKKPKDNNDILESIAYVKGHNPKADANVEMRTHLSDEALANSRSNVKHGHSHGLEGLTSIAPVAWMIIFGDSLHNFIDGLGIGAAFTESAVKGSVISIAVMCEEFPHELGDFAILINAGMSYKMALFANFLSACSCFLGLVLGIKIGEDFGEMIFAIAGGMFVYIALCAMIPELNEMGEDIERDYLREKYSMNSYEHKTLNNNDSREEDHLHKIFDFGIKLKILVIQNIGILIGLFLMFFMAFFSDFLEKKFIPEE